MLALGASYVPRTANVMICMMKSYDLSRISKSNRKWFGSRTFFVHFQVFVLVCHIFPVKSFPACLLTRGIRNWLNIASFVIRTNTPAAIRAKVPKRAKHSQPLCTWYPRLHINVMSLLHLHSTAQPPRTDDSPVNTISGP